MTTASSACLIVGLRNPGASYEQTRHNIGAVAVDRFLSDNDLTMKSARHGIRADVAETNLSGTRAVVAIPRTFMNESGQAVAPLMKYYGIEPDDLLVVHDDIDVPFAKLKVAVAGGHGGNNGVRSIIGSISTKEFWRLKIGVGRPPSRMEPADFVLGRFKGAEREPIEAAVYRASDVIEQFIKTDGENARQYAGELNE